MKWNKNKIFCSTKTTFWFASKGGLIFSLTLKFTTKNGIHLICLYGIFILLQTEYCSVCAVEAATAAAITEYYNVNNKNKIKMTNEGNIIILFVDDNIYSIKRWRRKCCWWKFKRVGIFLLKSKYYRVDYTV